ncbi:MAG: amino acid ABC transporter permease [Bellilinea sp.]|jgi:polar amino acid transport system permease protein
MQNTIVQSTRPDRGKQRFDQWWLLVLAVVALILILVSSLPDPYGRILTFVSDGIWITIRTTAISFALVLILGLVVALGRLSKIMIIRGAATVYVEIIRGIPVLVQLIFWYFAFPPILINIGKTYQIAALINYKADPNIMAIVGLTVCYAAYMSEVYRAGIQSISKGQMEAARSLGMNYFQAMRFIILPQAVRVILPPVGNEFITLLKDTALVSVVGVSDLTRRGREFMATNFMPIEPWVIVSLLYLVMTLIAARVVHYIEQKTKIER